VSMIIIREESSEDQEAVFHLNEAAFPSSAEAQLVDVLRAQADPILSLVACAGELVVGHILFTPVTLSGHPELQLLGLAPMAVTPDQQNTGIGRRLVRAGLQRCRGLRAQAVVVLGHPKFYPRFGFVPASRFALDSDYDVPDEVFMAQELVFGSLQDVAGRISYHPAFADL
jgi:putative acetyltransferase